MEHIQNPKVFVSHASEDKQRFVRDFGKKLYANGIQAWVDEWEIQTGDSLVDKIFSEGIGEAQAIVIVLSQHSINKPWVKKELNVSVVRQIEDKIKLIPVVIDDCQVPESLRDTVWTRVRDLENYEGELGKIVGAIYGQNDRPALGTPPAYTQVVIDTLSGLTKVDSIVLSLACQQVIETGWKQVNSGRFLEKAARLGIQPDDVIEALAILDNNGYVCLEREIGDFSHPDFEITTQGFDQYARAYIDDYNDIFRSTLLQIINHDARENKAIAQALNQPLMIVNHIFGVLEDQGHIKTSAPLGSEATITSISLGMKRLLSS